jgi:hypothetical protein
MSERIAACYRLILQNEIEDERINRMVRGASLRFMVLEVAKTIDEYGDFMGQRRKAMDTLLQKAESLYAQWNVASERFRAVQVKSVLSEKIVGQFHLTASGKRRPEDFITFIRQMRITAETSEAPVVHTLTEEENTAVRSIDISLTKESQNQFLLCVKACVGGNPSFLALTRQKNGGFFICPLSQSAAPNGPVELQIPLSPGCYDLFIAVYEQPVGVQETIRNLYNKLSDNFDHSIQEAVGTWLTNVGQLIIDARFTYLSAPTFARGATVTKELKADDFSARLDDGGYSFVVTGGDEGQMIAVYADKEEIPIAVAIIGEDNAFASMFSFSFDSYSNEWVCILEDISNGSYRAYILKGS